MRVQAAQIRMHWQSLAEFEIDFHSYSFHSAEGESIWRFIGKCASFVQQVKKKKNKAFFHAEATVFTLTKYPLFLVFNFFAFF